jgi:serine/threonine protein kinase
MANGKRNPPGNDKGKTVFVASSASEKIVPNKGVKTQNKTVFTNSQSHSKNINESKKTVIITPSSQKQDGEPKAKTLIKPEKDRSNKPVVKKLPAGKEQVAALTKIRQSIVKQDNSQGFAKAKKAADKALAGNKIILNRRFVLEKTLGAGGMGTVYKAKDLRKIEANDRNPYVAVKILNEGFKDHPDAFVTLQREASRSHLLSHPKIVTVHDFDRDGDIFYMTMELLEGKPLDVLLSKIRNKGLPLEKALQTIADICDALAYAHKKDIIHSDLKPGNAFVTKESTKILDFGIARLTCNSDGFDSGSLGALTPAYASLEMIEGKPPHPSDDLYAIAIIAYELLSGRHPYDRMPADEALKSKKKPKKLAALKSRQWGALEKALQLRGDKRTKSVSEFQKAFFEKKKFPIFKLASAILLVVCAIFAYVFLYVIDDIDSHIKQAMAEANSCRQQEQYDCAIEKYQTVLELQPDNSQVSQLLNETRALSNTDRISTLISEINDCLTNKHDLVCALSKKQEAAKLGISEKDLNHLNQNISEYKKDVKIAELLTTTSKCFEEKQFDCVKESADEILALDNSNTRALKLKLEVIDILNKQQEKEKEKEQLFIAAISMGQQCLKKEMFKCAISKFKEALSIRKTDPEAQALLQNAIFSRNNKEAAYNKAGKLISKAEACFKKKKYSCAISNAESALEFVPNYGKAITLKKKAEQEQQDAKRSFTIE